MDPKNCPSLGDVPSVSTGTVNWVAEVHRKAQMEGHEESPVAAAGMDVDIDLREIYFLIMHFLSAGPCRKTFEQFWNELLEYELLPRRYHACYSRSDAMNGDGNDNGKSIPLNYGSLVGRYSHIEKDHLVKLLKQLMLTLSPPLWSMDGRVAPSAADVPTLIGSGSFSLLSCEREKANEQARTLPSYLRWPHLQADQVRGLSLREIGGGFSKHHRAPSIRFACYAIAKPSSMVGKMQNVKKLRGHRDAVYCGIVLSLDSALTNITSAIFDRSGRYVITGSDDRLVKIWSMETAFCLASCRGHEGDITDLSVSSNNAVVASASNDFSIRVWRLPDGHPISVLHGHTGAVTAIAFSPRVKPLNAVYQLLSSSDDGTCRVWDARYSQCSPQVYMPKSIDNPAARNSGLPSAGASSTTVLQGHQILCCAYNANGTFFVTGSSDTYARVWSASRPIADDPDQPIHEIDKLAGHENDVNYVQFSGCTVASRALPSDSYSEDSIPKFRNSWFNHDNIVTCSRDGSAIIWIPRSRRFNGKVGRWVQAYHLKVPPPPMPPRPPRGGPRQRLLPTPRGVNMIMWSLDNRFVLAAIMDNRICVWNANDGSLVHCLAGHTASTYVLDVHPFNPRIIMSAGYDGKMILWDIWEGTPIRVYDIVGRFKLVDGKFSQDGTSIVLSDDVGQIYLIDTGEGESQKDAKYDQFFLGDYRPLAQDTHGSVVDQETQLSAYVRNIQDPICDSSMLPYPEPYQSMFQRRRLGALGIEWRPSSIKFAVGTDIGFGQEFQILPLADLDAVFEPMPDYLDAVYWEPENDGMNDENDSEYNVNEDYLSDVQACRSGSTSNDSDCSEESKVRRHHKDSIRRSKRKKTESDVEMVTYSGRRVKKRNALERRGSLSRCKRSKKLEVGPGTSRRKSSQSKSLRPLRIAARNAINSFSQITESCSEEDDEDDLTGDSSNCESSLEGSASQMQGQNDNLPSWPRKYSVDAERSLSGSDDISKLLKPPDSQTSAESRKKLVLKIPLRHHSKPPFPENLTGQPQGQTSVASSTLIVHEYNPEDGGVHSGSGDPESASTCVIDQEHSERYSRQSTDVNKPTEADNKLRTTPDGGGSMSWGKVKIRPPNDTQLGNVVLLSNGSFPHGDQDKSTLYDNSLFRDHTQMDSDSGLSNKQNVPDGGKGSFNNCESSNLNNDANSQPKNDVRKKPIILKIKQPKPLQNSPSKLPSQGPSDASLSATADSTSERLSLMLEKPLCGPMAETGSDDPNYMPYCDILGRDFESNISLHNPELLTDLPDMATDAVRRSRSFNVKVAMKEKVHDAIEMDGEYLLPATSRGSEKSSKRDLYESPSQRWISMSRHTIRSRSQRENSNHGSKRLNWLLLTEPEEEDRYIPQLADEVVYLRQGHQEYIESLGTSNSDPWWKYRDELRAVEICLVENLKYKTNPGSGCSCCKITLKLIDPSGHLFGQNFQVTLTELHDFPDFIVEKTRYDAAMERNWRIMDECRVWWRDENKEGRTWWNCRIVDIKDKSSDFPGSPWEKYIVQYETDDTSHRHCPWEFFDSSTSWDPPNIDISARESVKSYLSDLLKKASKDKDQYGILKLNQDAQKPGFINRFPVPLSPEIIMLRLENNYYRSLDALRHDVNIMLSNAESYFSRNTDILKKLKRLSNCFLNLLRDS